MIRIQKLLAGWGIASRRHIEQLISESKITVNDEPVTLGYSLDEQNLPIIKIEGKVVKPPKTDVKEIYIFNKPKLVVSTLQDEKGRQCIADFVPANKRLYPVGRLDLDSTGILLLTNYGELTNRLLHPSYKIEKEYWVNISGEPLTKAEEQSFRTGVMLDDKVTQPCTLKKLKGLNNYLVTLREGRNRQVKRMFEFFNRRVLKLHRVRFGPLLIKGVEKGAMRCLTPEEEALLLRAVKLTAAVNRGSR